MYLKQKPNRHDEEEKKNAKGEREEERGSERNEEWVSRCKTIGFLRYLWYKIGEKKKHEKHRIYFSERVLRLFQTL